MEVTNYKCDICGKVEASQDYDCPSGWLHISRSSDDEKDFWHRSKDVCGTCARDIIKDIFILHIA